MAINQQKLRQITAIGSAAEAFFNAPFRPLFWLGALFGCAAIALWALAFGGVISFNPYAGSYAWHQHEMLFGFFAAIVTGFLLTAVQNWTGRHSVGGWPLAGLVALWLAGRLVMAFPELASNALRAAVDGLFLPLAGLFLARPIVQAKLWRNLFFVPLLLIMATLNALFHLSAAGAVALPVVDISHAMILLSALVMAIMGGRVLPMFTANGTQTARVAPIAWLERVSIASVALVVLLALTQSALASGLQVAALAVAGISNFCRCWRWKIWVTLKVPLVWSLQLSYLAMSIGFLLLAANAAGLLQQVSVAYHTIAVGGMGLMILSMISRVSLGHSGRAIVADRWLTWSLVSLVLAALVRSAGPYLSNNTTVVIYLAATLWAVGYGIYCLTYAAVVFSKQVDGR